MRPETVPAAATADSGEPLLVWLGFGLFVVVMLVLDLKVFHKHPHEVKTKEALGWSIFWIALALLFNVGVYLWIDAEKAGEFLAAYLIEKSLSVDNLFVFIVLFDYFKIPGLLQHRVLFLGILGAIVMRLAFILAGSALLHQFEWMMVVFGGFLVLTGIKLLFQKEGGGDPEKTIAVRLARKMMPVTSEFHGTALTVMKDGVRHATPLLLVLIVIELTDVVFAVDSVPACLAVSTDPFIVFTSNIFAILGLRALYFLLARFLGSFHYLKIGLAVVLAFVGVKMSLPYFDKGWKIPIPVSLGVIGGVLLLATAASLLVKPKAAAPHEPAAPPPPPQ